MRMRTGWLTTVHGAAFLLGLALVGTALSGCGADKETAASVEHLTWVLQSYRDANGETKAVPPDMLVDAVFATGTISGSSGCNSYRGAARISGRTMEIGPLATARKMCPPPVMEIEQAYLANLERAATFSGATRQDSGSLAIFDAVGDKILAFVTETRMLPGSSWILTSYNNGKGGVVSALADTRVSIAFAETGDLAGLAGCNSYWGTYTTEDDKLLVNSLDSTNLSCTEPAGIMEQEKACLEALRDATTFEIEGDTLELRSSDGDLLASYDAWKLPPGG